MAVRELRPLVGVMPLWDEEKKSIWMVPGYLDGIREAGGIPFIFPLTDDEEELKRLMDMCGGLLFTGGQDVDPGIYGEEIKYGSVEICRQRDIMEHYVLNEAVKTDKSVLGICRGIQFINAALGGTLYQDLSSQHPSDTCHRQQPPYDVPSHEVSVEQGSPLAGLLGTDCIAVNSCHHQAVKELAPDLRAMAHSADGLIEAVYMPRMRFLWAVQWHPEFSWKTDAFSRKIFGAFIRSIF